MMLSWLLQSMSDASRIISLISKKLLLRQFIGPVDPPKSHHHIFADEDITLLP